MRPVQSAYSIAGSLSQCQVLSVTLLCTFSPNGVYKLLVRNHFYPKMCIFPPCYSSLCDPNLYNLCSCIFYIFLLYLCLSKTEYSQTKHWRDREKKIEGTVWNCDTHDCSCLRRVEYFPQVCHY